MKGDDQFGPGCDRLRWVDLVNVVATDMGHRIVTEEEAAFILYEHTPFPFGSVGQVREALLVYFHHTPRGVAPPGVAPPGVRPPPSRRDGTR